jgi:hypothetical protein
MSGRSRRTRRLRRGDLRLSPIEGFLAPREKWALHHKSGRFIIGRVAKAARRKYGSCLPSSVEKDFDLPPPRAARTDELTVTFVVEYAAQGFLAAAPVRSLAAIPLEPVGFQSRHRVRHHLVMPEEHERAAESLAMEPLDFRSLRSDVARRSNDGAAVTVLDLFWTKIRPDPLAQVLGREGVVALAVKYLDKRSLDLAAHKHRTLMVSPVFRRFAD